MDNLYILQDIVQEVLEEDEHARCSDNYLFLQVLGRILRNSKKRTVEEVLSNPGLPKFSSVSRARRKIQQKCPNLRASRKIEEGRTQKEEVYRKYARS